MSKVSLPVKDFTALALLLFCGSQLLAQPTAQPTDLSPHPPVPYDGNTLKKNYVRTWEAAAPITDPNLLMAKGGAKEVRQTTQYVDGLGRPLQTVVKQGSHPTGGSAVDMVSAVEYDAFGREVRKYLPFASSSSSGTFKLDPFTEQKAFYDDPEGMLKGQGESWYYGRTHYEASPMNRPLESFAPGNSWVGTNFKPTEAERKSVKMKYWINTAADDVRIWSVTDNGVGNFGSYTSSGSYPAGELYKNVTEDEHGKQVVEFKDKEGKVILKKVQLLDIIDGASVKDDGSGRGYKGWLCTYYLYDDLGQLRCVVQPRGVELIDPASTTGATWALSETLLSEQCFRYEYDERGRMIVKKVPGAAEVFMVYDARDRLVLTQDGNMRGQDKWLFTKYDQLNRPVITGFYVNGASSQKAMQDYLNSQSLGLYERIVSTSLPFYSLDQSFPVVGVDAVQTMTYYDDYGWTQNIPEALRAFDASFNAHFPTEDNSNFPYPRGLTPQLAVKGLTTGTIVRVPGITWLASVLYYDDRGRVIQAKQENITEGVDIITSQYSFSGQLLQTVLRHHNKGANEQTHLVQTRNTYDNLGRLSMVEKKINSTIGTTAVTQNWKTVASLEYDALGQVKQKTLGSKEVLKGSYIALEVLHYDYNIRGWLLGTNREYAKDKSSTSNYFGFDLAYDKTALGAIGSYNEQQLNGNIAGTVWKSKGDNEVRKYDFAYDGVNRLTGAVFRQNTGGTTWSNTEVDFTVDNLSYDGNGNIKTMDQKGWKLTGSTHIDRLQYNYVPNSNRLLNVIDGSNDAATKLGDFRTSALHPSSGGKTSATEDYSYDVNGNLVKDLNKDLVTYSGAGGIAYNHLNLPIRITVKKDATSNKGTIEYVYDAAGNKLKKITKETLSTPTYSGELTLTTTYIGGFVYQSRQYVPLHPDQVNHANYTDLLQFFAHEEGRVRLERATTATCTAQPDRFIYDYFLKDHLGNVRMVLTEQSEPVCYIAASSEDSRQGAEKQIYDIVDSRRKTLAEANVPSSYTQFEAKVYETNGSVEGKRTGLGAVLKVMAGDQVRLTCQSYYNKPVNGTTDNNYPAVTELLNALVNSTGVAAKEAMTAQQVYDYATNPSSLSPFLQSTPPPNTANAYLNWIFFDEQMKYVAGGVDPVNEGGGYKLHVPNSVTAAKNGFLYVYVSNQSNYPVYFDNLAITHTPGAILEETHYYPFGLTMAGISSKAVAGIDNRYEYNKGSELLNREFSDGSGLEWYATNFRMYDPQLGRWHVVDPKPTHDESLYAAMLNNPILYNDPLGDSIPRFLRAPIQNVNGTAKGLVFGLNGRYQLEPARGSTVTGIRDTKAGGKNASGKIKGIDVIRVDQAHGKGKSAIGPHLNINEKVTGVPDPHIRLTGTQFKVFKTAGQVLDGMGKIAKPVAIVTDAVQLGDAIKTDIQQGTGGDNTIVAGSRISGGWAGAAAGATLGGKGGISVGSFFGPVGTAIGGFVGAIGGGIVGGIFGSNGGEAVGEKIVQTKNED